MRRMLPIATWLLLTAIVGCGGGSTNGGSGGAATAQGGSTQSGASGTSAVIGSSHVTGGTQSAGGASSAIGGSSVASGSTKASSGGVSASGGASSAAAGTPTLDCHFTYTNKVSTSVSDCHVSGASQHSCDEAATCICVDPLRGSGCYAFYMTPHGSASFTDFCAHSPTATTVRSLAEALTMMASSENSTVTTSADCSLIRAIL